MNSLEQLKSELLEQKSAIEEKGGTVTVANTNPSPSEITAGIKSIVIPSVPDTPTEPDTPNPPSIDLSAATATEGDVISGKTFFAVDSSIRAGTLVAFSQTDLYRLFYSGDELPEGTEAPAYNLTLSGMTIVRPHVFYQSHAKLTVTLPTNLVEIGDHAFHETDVTLTNISALSSLYRIGQYGISGAKGVDLANLPASIVKLDTGATYDVESTSNEIKVNANMVTMMSYNFGYSTPHVLDNVDISQLRVNSPAYFCRNVEVDGDLVFPTTCTATNDHCLYNANFNNVIIHAGFKNLGTYSFTGLPSTPNANFKTQGYVFLGETPPTIGMSSFNIKTFNNGGKIYCPDNAVEVYKTTRNLTTFANFIHPLSERP